MISVCKCVIKKRKVKKGKFSKIGRMETVQLNVNGMNFSCIQKIEKMSRSKNLVKLSKKLKGFSL